MFYHRKTNTYIKQNTSFVLDGVMYPSNWISQATLKEKAELGIEDVVTVGQREDEQLFFVSEELIDGEIRITNTPRQQEDIDRAIQNRKMAEVNYLESVNMMPRVLREFIILQYENIAKQDGVDPMEIYGYKKVKELDDQIKTILGKKE